MHACKTREFNVKQAIKPARKSKPGNSQQASQHKHRLTTQAGKRNWDKAFGLWTELSSLFELHGREMRNLAIACYYAPMYQDNHLRMRSRLLVGSPFFGDSLFCGKYYQLRTKIDGLGSPWNYLFGRRWSAVSRFTSAAVTSWSSAGHGLSRRDTRPQIRMEAYRGPCLADVRLKKDPTPLPS